MHEGSFLLKTVASVSRASIDAITHNERKSTSLQCQLMNLERIPITQPLMHGSETQCRSYHAYEQNVLGQEFLKMGAIAIISFLIRNGALIGPHTALAQN